MSRFIQRQKKPRRHGNRRYRQIPGTAGGGLKAALMPKVMEQPMKWLLQKTQQPVDQEALQV